MSLLFREEDSESYRQLTKTKPRNIVCYMVYVDILQTTATIQSTN